VNGCMTLEVH